MGLNFNRRFFVAVVEFELIADLRYIFAAEKIHQSKDEIQLAQLIKIWVTKLAQFALHGGREVKDAHIASWNRGR